jgi:hypothetical protein
MDWISGIVQVQHTFGWALKTGRELLWELGFEFIRSRQQCTEYALKFARSWECHAGVGFDELFNYVKS